MNVDRQGVERDVNMEELPTLMKVRQAHDLTSRQLADAAGVPLRVEYVAEIGGLVEEVDAGLLLEAVSNLTGKHYTLKNVQMNIKGRQLV